MLEAGETEFIPETFVKYLYHPEVPDCDMIVRTSGEERSLTIAGTALRCRVEPQHS